MDQVKKNIDRAMELTVEVERCQELNVSGEKSLADNDIAKAEEYFNQADEALDTEKWNLAELADEKSPFWQGSPHSDYVTAWQELVDLQPQFAKWREA